MTPTVKNLLISLLSVGTFAIAPCVWAEPDVLTLSNRQAPTMSGGWGPHLRSPMTMADSSEWFAAEAGTDVLRNSAMVYYRKDEAGWKAVGSMALYSGIQQNMASITDGRYIFSYGINPKDNWLMECWFDTQKPGYNLRQCNAVLAGSAPMKVSANSNYIGAAMRSDKTRIAWWTTVGPGGANGTFLYAFNHAGRGWNGPVPSGIGGFGDVGYIHARFDENKNLRLFGQLYVGQYPGGRYQAAVSTLVLGQNTLWTAVDGATSVADLWYDPASRTTHVLAIIPSGVGYYFSGPGKWPSTGVLVRQFPGAFRMRFAPDGKGGVTVIEDVARDNVFRLHLFDALDLTARLDFEAAPFVDLPRPEGEPDGGLISAIWTQDPAKQLAPISTEDFAVGGSYPAWDQRIHHYVFRRSE